MTSMPYGKRMKQHQWPSVRARLQEADELCFLRVASIAHRVAPVNLSGLLELEGGAWWMEEENRWDWIRADSIFGLNDMTIEASGVSRRDPPFFDRVAPLVLGCFDPALLLAERIAGTASSGDISLVKYLLHCDEQPLERLTAALWPMYLALRIMGGVIENSHAPRLPAEAYRRVAAWLRESTQRAAIEACPPRECDFLAAVEKFGQIRIGRLGNGRHPEFVDR